jgi:electron transfer flavoprotein beta subunit
MKIICLIKFVPDTDNFVYDYERNLLLRENMDLILNPDDACALACALKLKHAYTDVNIEIVSMAPLTVLDQIRDLVRLHVDKAALISDRAYAGSDTYATARILARYLRDTGFDLILSGARSLDGDTAHIPPQLACLLGDLPQVSGVYQVNELCDSGKSVIVETEDEDQAYTWQVDLPAVISMTRNIAYKLPFVRYADLDLEVDDKIRIITNRDLQLKQDEMGMGGSLTRVARTWAKPLPDKEKVVLGCDDDGIETVYRFLADHDFV